MRRSPTGSGTLTAQDAHERDALAAASADCVVTSLHHAVEQIVNVAREAASADVKVKSERPPR
jgi:predicted RNase H-like nuclease (RuvC/YqgF family)